MKLLIINPGATSTKIAVFEDEEQLFKVTIDHSAEELDRFPRVIDQADYRIQVRIVTIPGADVCACCGTHTAATGAVGQIKILAAENYKGGVRLSIVCGERALLAAQAMRQRHRKNI